MSDNPIKIFSGELGHIRTTIQKNQPYFLLKDVCKILGISSTSQVKGRLDPNGMINEKVKFITGEKSNGDPAVQHIEMSFIDEPNLYKTIFQSRKPVAEHFADWLTKDVLPKIRKYGFYALDELLEDPEFLVKTIESLKKEREKRVLLEMKSIVDKPKVDYFESMAGSKTAVELKNLHKALNLRNITRSKLLELLREEQILDKENIPYMQYIDRGYFRVIEQRYTLPKGDVRIDIKSIVYLKGVNFIRDLILKKAGKTNEVHA
jgi:prophage antirepressor-like protein